MRMSNKGSFFKYVLPSVFAFALSGVYTVVDGLFVGHELGDLGLATINLSFPIASFIQAIGTGIGLAGAIQFTIFKARGEREKENEYFNGTIFLLLLTSIVLTVLFALLANPILHLLGAEGDILNLASKYVKVIALGAIFQIFATGLIPFVRNMGGATFAMLAMVAGFLTNIVLDYLFIWVYGWGVTGAAAATIIGQCVTMIATICFLFRKKAALVLLSSKRMLAVFSNVIEISLAPFGLTFSPIITIIFMNRFLMEYGGANSVAVYACISYITAIVYLLLQGVGDGSQPLISRYYGKKDMTIMKETRSLSYKTSLFIALVCMVVLFIARNYVGSMFGASVTAGKDVAFILPMFLAGFVFLAFVRVTTSFFYATEQSRLSYVLVYAEPILLLALLFVLPPIFGIYGVWVAVPLSQVITWIIAIFAKHRVDVYVLNT